MATATGSIAGKGMTSMGAGNRLRKTRRTISAAGRGRSTIRLRPDSRSIYGETEICAQHERVSAYRCARPCSVAPPGGDMTQTSNRLLDEFAKLMTDMA